MKNSCQLNLIILEAIDKGLSIVCGSAAPSVLFFLENYGAIKSKSHIENLESFSEGLEKIFGFGSKVIEKKILEVLYSNLQLPQPTEIQDEFEFAKEVEKISNLCEADQLVKREKKN
ncbi:MAG: hypothetical protein OEY24_00465 [Candidatus Bathyarchaeota archaeon]|nr:hypothetical protein [Candidatus Bathyarchaeota archaeon]MDH5494166.1 hypothetical protein [Candidatus Bathyarchaeota archaeon]